MLAQREVELNWIYFIVFSIKFEIAEVYSAFFHKSKSDSWELGVFTAARAYRTAACRVWQTSFWQLSRGCGRALSTQLSRQNRRFSPIKICGTLSSEGHAISFFRTVKDSRQIADWVSWGRISHYDAFLRAALTGHGHPSPLWKIAKMALFNPCM